MNEGAPRHPGPGEARPVPPPRSGAGERPFGAAREDGRRPVPPPRTGKGTPSSEPRDPSEREEHVPWRGGGNPFGEPDAPFTADAEPFGPPSPFGEGRGSAMPFSPDAPIPGSPSGSEGTDPGATKGTESTDPADTGPYAQDRGRANAREKTLRDRFEDLTDFIGQNAVKLDDWNRKRNAGETRGRKVARTIGKIAVTAAVMTAVGAVTGGVGSAVIAGALGAARGSFSDYAATVRAKNQLADLAEADRKYGLAGQVEAEADEEGKTFKTIDGERVYKTSTLEIHALQEQIAERRNKALTKAAIWGTVGLVSGAALGELGHWVKEVLTGADASAVANAADVPTMVDATTPPADPTSAIPTTTEIPAPTTDPVVPTSEVPVPTESATPTSTEIPAPTSTPTTEAAPTTMPEPAPATSEAAVPTTTETVAPPTTAEGTPVPTPPPAPAAEGIPTPGDTPLADDVQWNTVDPGESFWEITSEGGLSDPQIAELLQDPTITSDLVDTGAFFEQADGTPGLKEGATPEQMKEAQRVISEILKAKANA